MSLIFDIALFCGTKLRKIFLSIIPGYLCSKLIKFLLRKKNPLLEKSSIFEKNNLDCNQ